jgi:hypothetical protein
MKYDLKSPCKDCPFRTGEARTAKAADVATPAQMDHALRGDGYDYSQSCHKTNGGDARREQYCVGAALSLLKRGRSTRTLDEAQAAGRYDPASLDASVEVL